MKHVIVGMLATTICGCATTGTTSKSDPLEDFNRTMFAFNIAVDDAVLEPASSGYKAVTPEWGRDRVSDFLQNLGEPVNFANSALQGDVDQALQTGFRFAVNSTIGLAGLFDLAQYEGFEVQKEDFGQTLAVWGVDSGPYLVLPFVGSSNPRDLLGSGVDTAINPINYAEYGNDEDINTGFRTTQGIVGLLNTRVAIAPQIEQLLDQPEPYIALRDIHTKQRDAQIRNGQKSQDLHEELSDFDDF